MLAWTIYIAFIGAVVCFLLPKKDPALIRVFALATALGSLAFALIGARQSDPDQIFTLELLDWIPSLGISYNLATDGISTTLVILTALASVAGVLFSWNIAHRANLFFGLYFALLTGVYGVFLSFDLFLFFVFYEIAIIPKYFLIAIWGSTRKSYGAMKLALYSFAGSALVLLVLIAAYVASGKQSFSYFTLAQTSFAPSFQHWAFPVMFIGFAVLAGLWPFHTWAPTGHVAAPTAASMLLAGVVMKLGAYAALRVPMVLFPEGYNMWQGPLASFAVAGIVGGAMVALTQRDFKFVIGYSSVSHMGFVLLGLMAGTPKALGGAVLQMFSHGIIAGLLFAVVGRMIYERTHTRDLEELASWRLNKKLPFASVVFLLAALASMGFPGFSGFIAELTILIGVWPRFPLAAIIAGAGILIGIAFTLRALLKGFYTESLMPSDEKPVEPISWPEKAGAVLLLGATLAVGLYPRLLLDLIMPAINSSIYFQALK